MSVARKGLTATPTHAMPFASKARKGPSVVKLPGLVSALAMVDGRPEAAIGHVARQLREGGHIPGGKRGHGGPTMGFGEAAKLLVALNTCADWISDPVAAVSYYSRSILTEHLGWSAIPRLAVFDRIESAPNGVAAIAAFLEGAPELADHYIAVVARDWNSPLPSEVDFRWLHYHVTCSPTRIELGVVDGVDQRGWRASFCVRSHLETERNSVAAKFDRYTQATFGLQTAVEVWQAIGGQAYDGVANLREHLAAKQKRAT